MRHYAKILTLSAALLAVGCGSDETFNFGTFNPGGGGGTVQVPVAVADTFQVLGDGILTASVTANDTVNGATVVAFQNTGTGGGAVAISSGGTLTYTPPLNTANIVDTFSYTLANSAGTSTATVTVNVGARGLFVKNDVAATGTGTQANPFKTLHEAVLAAPPTGGAIAIFRGDGTSTGLATAETIPTNVTVQAVDPANAPLVTGPWNLSGNNALTSLNFAATAPAAINATNAANGTLSSLNVTTTGNKAAFLGNSTGTWTIQNSRFANANLGALDATCSTGTLNWSVLNCTFTNCLVDVVGNTTLSAVQTMTVRNSNFNNGRGQAVGAVGASSAANLTIVMTNNNVQGAGTALRGLEVTTQNTCNTTISCHNNTITGCVSQGVLLDAQGVSNAAARFNNNQLTGNSGTQSFVAGNNGSAGLRLALDTNVADRYVIGNGGGPTNTFVEDLSTLTTRNTGVFANSGLVDGPCPAP